jgi:hypothetical protein
VEVWFSYKFLIKNTTQGIEESLDHDDKGIDTLNIYKMKMNDLLNRDIKEMNEINTKATFGKLDAAQFMKKTHDIANNITRHYNTFNKIYDQIFKILIQNNNKFTEEDGKTNITSKCPKILCNVFNNTLFKSWKR